MFVEHNMHKFPHSSGVPCVYFILKLALKNTVEQCSEVSYFSEVSEETGEFDRDKKGE